MYNIKVKITDVKALKSILPQNLEKAIKNRGYKKISEFGEFSDVWQSPNRKELIVPRASNIKDYHNIVSQIISILAEQENKSELWIWGEMM